MLRFGDHQLAAPTKHADCFLFDEFLVARGVIRIDRDESAFCLGHDLLSDDYDVVIQERTIRFFTTCLDDDVADLVAGFHLADTRDTPHRQTTHARTPQVIASRSVTSGELMMVSVTTHFMPSFSTSSAWWASCSSMTRVPQISR